jgi:hypothetical protein
MLAAPLPPFIHFEKDDLYGDFIEIQFQGHRSDQKSLTD